MKLLKLSNEKITVIMLILLIFILIIYDLLGAGHTTNDDATLAIQYGTDKGVFSLGWDLAIVQGRIGFLWGYSFLQIPYFINLSIWYLAMKFIPILILGFCTGLFISKYTNWRVGLFAAILFFTLMQNGWEHNALTSYPFAISFIAILLIMSLMLFDYALQRRNVVLTILASILFFLTLTNELFVLYFPLFVVIYMHRTKRLNYFDRSNARHLIIISLSVLLYLIAYFIWRMNYPSGYDGNTINQIKIKSILNVIATYSVTAFPITPVLHLIRELREAAGYGLDVVFIKIIQIDASNYSIGAITSLATFLLVSNARTQTLSLANSSIVIYLSMLYIFVPNILLGLVKRHQDWVAAGVRSYLYTYYSLIAAVIFISTIIFVCGTLIYKKSNLIHIIYAVLVSIIVGFLAFTVALYNKPFAEQQILSNDKWRIIDKFLASNEYLSIPEDAIISAPTLVDHYKGIMQAPAQYWSWYFKNRGVKKVTITTENCSNINNCYTLIYRQSENKFQYLAFFKLKNNLKTDKLYILKYPAGQKLLLQMPRNGKLDNPIGINGMVDIQINNSNLSGYVDHKKGSIFDQVIISGVGEINPNAIVYSVISSRSENSLIDFSFLAGFYESEKHPSIGDWQWSRDKSSIKIVNKSREKKSVIIKFSIQAIEDMDVTISSPSNSNTIKLKSGKLHEYHLKEELPINSVEIHFSSNKKPIKNMSDVRELSFRIINMNIIEVSE